MPVQEIKSGTLYKVYCTQVQIEMMPSGVVKITAFEGSEVGRVFEVVPEIVIVDTSSAKAETRLVNVTQTDQTPFKSEFF